MTIVPEPSKAQFEICRKNGVSPDPPNPLSKLGISRTFSSRDFPLNGLRHPAEEGTNGWFLWSGSELSHDPDFFVPLHAMHIKERFPEIEKYLALPPGWRFLVAPGQEDIWFDESLLKI
jgi:hypothetical protein